MSTRPHHTIAQQLNAGQLAISNSLSDPEIQSLVAQFGYPADKLSEGKALYDAALAAVNAEKAAAGAQQEATRTLVQAETSAHDAYQALAKVARAVFGKDKAQLNALGLNGTMPKDTAGFLASAYTLFDNARTLPALADYGYDLVKTPKRARQDRLLRYRQPRAGIRQRRGAASHPRTAFRFTGPRRLDGAISQDRKGGLAR